jgi:hypothetical protein
MKTKATLQNEANRKNSEEQRWLEYFVTTILAGVFAGLGEPIYQWITGKAVPHWAWGWVTAIVCVLIYQLATTSLWNRHYAKREKSAPKSQHGMCHQDTRR